MSTPSTSRPTAATPSSKEHMRKDDTLYGGTMSATTASGAEGYSVSEGVDFPAPDSRLALRKILDQPSFRMTPMA